MEETILNLGMNIPMLAMGFKQFQTALGLPGIKEGIANIQKARTAVTELREAEAILQTQAAKATLTVEQKAAAEAEAAAAAKALKAAELEAAAAARALALSLGLIGGTALIMGVTMAISAMDEAEKNAIETQKELYNTAQETASSLRESISS